MTGILYIILSVISIILWKVDFKLCSDLCNNVISIGYLDRSWFLWGAVYFSIAGILTAWFKKNWIVIMLLANGILFHFFLLTNTYKTIKFTCPICIAFFIANIILLILYNLEGSQKYDKIFAAGPGKTTLTIAAIIFALNPIGLEEIHIGLNEADATISSQHEKSKEITYKKPGTATVTQQTYGIENPDTTKNMVEDTSTFLVVENSDGNTTQLDISQKPALFFSWWCANCDQVLKDYAQYNPDKRPYMVAIFLKGTDDKKYIEQKLQANGIKGEYYIYKKTPPIESVPMLIWWSEGKIKKTAPTTGAQSLLSIARIKVGNDNGGYNATLAGTALNDTVILQGEVFSFNNVVGERTHVRGYRVSRVITNNGNGFEYTEGIGGGICRTSTVLNWAVENAGLEIIEQHPHSLPVEYGKIRKDTAVAWPSLDYRFKNNTDRKIAIKIKTIGEWLEIEIWSSN